MAAPRFNPLHYGEGFLTADTRLETILPSGFNPLHYGEGFLTELELCYEVSKPGYN